MANLCDSFLYPAVRLNKFNYSIIQIPKLYFIILVFEDLFLLI